MADNLTPLVIKVKSRSIPNGNQAIWNDIGQQINTFTRDIVTPALGDDNMGTIVSGMPTIFARANLFKLAIDYVNEADKVDDGLLKFYKQLVDEWRGFIACIAIDYAHVEAERISLEYSDHLPIGETANIYEPKGAFGNMLFERRPLWCDQDVAENEKKIPYINVVKYRGKVVGGTSPESLLFTSVAYRVEDNADHQPFIDVNTKKFTDPLKSKMNQEQLQQLYGYVKHILNRSLPEFVKMYAGLPDDIRMDPVNVTNNLQRWKEEMEQFAAANGMKLDSASVPQVSCFSQSAFRVLFNYSTQMYGSNGIIMNGILENGIPFDPRKLLLDDGAVIAGVHYGNEASKDPNFLRNNAVSLMRAEVQAMPGTYYYFTLPLSPLGLNVFGNNVDALVGINPDTDVQSRLTAVFDPMVETHNLKVKLSLVSVDGEAQPIEKVYTAVPNAIQGHDILIWPNFISKQWNRYFLYSEMPHNTASSQCRFRATPFVGDMDDARFPIFMDGPMPSSSNPNVELPNPIYLAKEGKVAVPTKFEDRLKVKLHVVSDMRVSDNQYKYEIYESSHPFKGIRLMTADQESGYAILRYNSTGGNLPGLPSDLLRDTKDLRPATLGIDFGSTNTSVAYRVHGNSDSTMAKGLKLTNKRISLFNSDKKNNNIQPAMEDEIFFFQNEEIGSNSIKSLLTIHDSKRLPEDGRNSTRDMIIGQAVTGGFPCFEKHLPIEGVTENRYKLFYRRSGSAEIVYDMKWSENAIENAYKKAYLGSLLLHIYAQLFEEGVIPVILNWSYPSSMSKNMINTYKGIWSSLVDVNPIVGGTTLNVAGGNVDVDSNGANLFTNGWGNAGGNTAALGGQQPSPWGAPAGQPMQQTSPWGAPAGGQQPVAGGWGATATPPAAQPQPVGGGWGNQNEAPQTVNINIDAGIPTFNFRVMGDTQGDNPFGGDSGAGETPDSMTESRAVANFIANSDVNNDVNSLTLCFDVGGSTTDISVLCQMRNPKDGQNCLALVKQNSIRFAAQRVSRATRNSKNIKDVLVNVCNQHNYRVQGLNVEPVKFTPEMAPYYFDQILDRLNTPEEFNSFYSMLSTSCPEIMSVNAYVTGLILYYAGQLTYKMINSLRSSTERNNITFNGAAWTPQVNVVFAGKGARIFDWLPAVDPSSANNYFQQQFINGMGGLVVAQQFLFGPPKINPTNQDGDDNVKYEVSKGLASTAKRLLVPQCEEAIEILGEEGFVAIQNGQPVPLTATNSITPEMMQYLGSYFMYMPQPGMPPCPKFMEFAGTFYQFTSTLFGLKMTQQEFMNGFNNMNINDFITNLPEYYAAKVNKSKNTKEPFDFVAPIIILEGMKFYDKYLMPCLNR